MRNTIKPKIKTKANKPKSNYCTKEKYENHPGVYYGEPSETILSSLSTISTSRPTALHVTVVCALPTMTQSLPSFETNFASSASLRSANPSSLLVIFVLLALPHFLTPPILASPIWHGRASPSSHLRSLPLVRIKGPWERPLLLPAGRPALGPASSNPSGTSVSTSRRHILILATRSGTSPRLPRTPPNGIHPRLLPGRSDVSGTLGRGLVGCDGSVRSSSGGRVGFIFGLGSGDSR